MIIHFDNVGTAGIIKDIPAHELPPEAWSSGLNVRFHDGKVEKIQGHLDVYNRSASLTSTLPIAPWWLLPVQSGSNYYWVYAGQNRVYVAAANSNGSEITRISASSTAVLYSATSNYRWNGGVLGGIGILNNGVDTPQMWTPTLLSTKLQALTYDASAGTSWSTHSATVGLGIKARVIRPFKNYGVALNITKGATNYPYMVKWSHPAEPGAVPETWDETKATKDAGEYQLATTGDYLVDCLPLRDVNMIYKEGSTWGQQFIGGKFVFRFYEIFKTFGALSTDCAVEFHGNHIVLADGDVVMHNGQEAKSIIDKKWRKWLFNDIDTTYYENCIVARNYLKNEIWICYPAVGSSSNWCNKALVWNYVEGTFTIVELPVTSHVSWGSVQTSGTVNTWTGMTGGLWNTSVLQWNARSYNPVIDSMLLASPATVPKLLKIDDTEQYDGIDFKAYVERTGLAAFRQARTGEVKVDKQNYKMLRGIYPRVDAADGTKLSVFGGVQQYEADAVVWSGPHTFTVGESLKVDLRLTGRLLAVKFETSANTSWRLTGYDLDVDKVGKF